MDSILDLILDLILDWTALCMNLVYRNFPVLQLLIASSHVPKVRTIQILQRIWQR